MRKKVLIYSGLGLLALLSIYTYTFQSKVVNMPYFSSMVGEGNLTSTVPIEGTSVEKAALKNRTKTVVFDGMIFSHFLSLETESEIIVAIATKSGKFLICPRGIEECISKFATPTKQEGANKLVTYSTFTTKRFVVELYEDILAYRIQYKNCFIGYPHGCLIHGFGWHDKLTFEFRH